MIHAISRITLCDADNLGGDACCCHVRWDIFQNHAACANACAGTDGNVSENFSTCSDKDAVLNFRMSIAACFTCSAEGDFVENGNVISDHCGFPDNNTCGMVDEEAFSNSSGGVDIYSKNLTDNALEISGHYPTVIFPEVVCCTIRGERLKSFKIEKRREVAAGRRIPGIDGNNIHSDAVADGGIIVETFFKQLVKIGLRDSMVAKFARNPVRKTRFESSVVEYTLLNEVCQYGLLLRSLFSLASNLRPDVIDAVIPNGLFMNRH